MAIYHFTVKTVSRGTASAKARSDYIEREGKYQRDHDEVLYSKSGNMPAWAEEHPRMYWHAADTYERANGRLFKQVEFAIPRELSQKGQIELVLTFCTGLAQTQEGPLPFSLAIHRGHDRENPHCHVMISERINDGHPRSPETWFKRAGKNPFSGGAKKTLELRPQVWLEVQRARWAQEANRALELEGHEARIDHRSLVAQGVEREPQQHLGPAAAAMVRKGMVPERTRGSTEGEEVISITKELEELKQFRDEIDVGMSEAREGLKAFKQRQEREREIRERAEELRRQKERDAQRTRERSRGGGMGW